MIKPTFRLLDSTLSPPPGIASQPKSGGGKEPGRWDAFGSESPDEDETSKDNASGN